MTEKCISEQKQTGAELSFIGGKPMMPVEAFVPRCELCKSDMTFFSQFDCQEIIGFSEHILSVFFCTNCQDDEYLIPPMLEGDIANVTVPAEFLSNSQVNFSAKIWLKEEISLRDTYEEKIQFHVVHDCADSGSRMFARLGGSPVWVLGDETPKSIGGKSPQFLVSICQDFEFPLIEKAPGQVEFDFMEGASVESQRRSYRLFLANEVYFYGASNGKNLVYAFTQVD